MSSTIENYIRVTHVKLKDKPEVRFEKCDYVLRDNRIIVYTIPCRQHNEEKVVLYSNKNFIEYIYLVWFGKRILCYKTMKNNTII